jgi:hypothetical protein
VGPKAALDRVRPACHQDLNASIVALRGLVVGLAPPEIHPVGCARIAPQCGFFAEGKNGCSHSPISTKPVMFHHRFVRPKLLHLARAIFLCAVVIKSVQVAVQLVQAHQQRMARLEEERMRRNGDILNSQKPPYRLSLAFALLAN